MHCPICDADSDTVTMEEPCADCQAAIQECIDGYPPLDAPVEVELIDDEFDVEPI